MVQALIRALFVLCLSAAPALAAAEEAPAVDLEPAPAEIEQLITTLEDPDARAELVGQLRVLLQADAAAEAEEEALPVSGDDLVEVTRSFVTNTWEALTSIEPRELLASLAVTIGIIVAALLVRWLLVAVLRRLYARLVHSPGSSDREVMEIAEVESEETAPGRRRPKLPAPIKRVINLIIAVIAIALIADTWGAGVSELMDTDLGARITEAALAIALILIITSVAWHFSGVLVARLLTLAGGRHRTERRARRLETLVPLLRSVLQVTIGVLAALLILSEIGVNIAPLLAGAGILGLAIGFGAQTLVKDIITGVTILLEDNATVGDVVEVAGHAGVVEEMRIRLIQLRDLSGTVHLIPYSEVSSIMNYTKDFAFYLIEMGVAYREDTDEVCRVLTEVAEEMSREEDYRSSILVPMEILGVDKFADSAVIIKARIKTTPGTQWGIGREFNRRLKKAFDSRGIEIPFPHRTLYFGEPKAGPAPPARLEVIEGTSGDGAGAGGAGAKEVTAS